MAEKRERDREKRTTGWTRGTEGRALEDGGQVRVWTDFGYGAVESRFRDCCILGSEEAVHNEWFGWLRFMKIILLLNVDAGASTASSTRLSSGLKMRLKLQNTCATWGAEATSKRLSPVIPPFAK